jgi:hypothetical protein
METITKHVPPRLAGWVNKLSPVDIATILTMVGDAHLHARKYSPRDHCLDSQSSAPAVVGAKGEQEVQRILQNRYTTTNTSKSGKCGDFVILCEGIKILIEVKKYSGTVPHTEVEKFNRDIEANTSVRGALFISLTSKIVGINRTIEYTHNNSTLIPVIFLSLKGLHNTDVFKECIYSAIDILISSVKSSSKYIDVGDKIISTVNEIDHCLDYLSQCRVIILETQNMFNKQLGKLMQQFLCAEINIKKSILSLKSTVDVLEVEQVSVSDALSKLSTRLDTASYNLLSKLLDGRSITVAGSNIIQSLDGKLVVKVMKTVIKVCVETKLTSLCTNEPWSYNGKVFSMNLTEHSLLVILNILN